MKSMCLEFNFETKLKMFLKNKIIWFKGRVCFFGGGTRWGRVGK